MGHREIEESARSMRAVKDSPATPLSEKGNVPEKETEGFCSTRALEDQPGYPLEEEVLGPFQTR
jgi:hypothetical protein